MSEFYPEAGVYDPANPAPLIDTGTAPSAGHGQTLQDTPHLFAGTSLSPAEYLARMSQAQDAAAASFPPDSLGAHVVGQDLRQLLAQAEFVKARLEFLSLAAFGAEHLPLRSEEALARLQHLTGLAESLKKASEQLGEAANKFHISGGWQAIATRDHLQQVAAMAKVQAEREAQAAAEQARQQAEADATEQRELGRLASLIEKLGFNLTPKKGE